MQINPETTAEEVLSPTKNAKSLPFYDMNESNELNKNELNEIEPLPRKKPRRKNPTNHHEVPPEQQGFGGEKSTDLPPGDLELKKTRQKYNDLRIAYTALYFQIGLLTSAFNQRNGTFIMVTAERRANELVDVATHHKQMIRYLRMFAQSNDYVTLAVGHLALFGACFSDRLPINDKLKAMLPQAAGVPPELAIQFHDQVHT